MNYYELLEIDSESTIREIRHHYYQLAKQYHPDKHQGNLQKQEHFKRLSEAYSTLSNPKKRYIYDLQLSFRIMTPWRDLLNIELSDEELLILYYYYQKIRNSTEIRFLELTFQSLPTDIKQRIYTKINELRQPYPPESLQCTTITDLSHQKTIDCTGLREPYRIQLRRPLTDVLRNHCKEIQLKLHHITWSLFITHSNYNLTFWNHRFPLVISIETLPE